MEQKIALIIPYFGKWPEWIDLYFYSCSRNPMIDFIIYTDCIIPDTNFNNIIFHKRTYGEYCTLISNKLGINYNYTDTYKLTDLKPFLGYIHEEELKEYNFWGVGDIDLVYGDLAMILNEITLNNYDVITTHNYHIAGHFCLCRNNKYYRELCFKIKNWEYKLTSSRPISLDELEWSDLICKNLRFIRRVHKYIFKPFGISYLKILDTLNPVLHKKILLKEFWTSPEPKDKQIWIYNVHEGKIYDFKKRELPYLHFLFFKKTKWLDTDKYWREGFYMISDIKDTDLISITNTRIYRNTNKNENN